jgi:hypothetical protein
MLTGYVNQLLLAFRYFTMGQVVPFPALTLRNPYPVVCAHRVTGPYEPTEELKLQSDYALS